MFKLKVNDDCYLPVVLKEEKKEISKHTYNEILFCNFELMFNENADDTSKSDKIKEFLDKSKEKPFLILNNENIEIGSFLVETYSSSWSNSSQDDYATNKFKYDIKTKEYEELNLEKLIINGSSYDVLRYSERVHENEIIVLEVIFKLSENEKENILKLKHDERYFDVDSIGIRKSSLRMRFGTIFWSIHDCFYKAGVTLVEDKYDEISSPIANIYLTNASNLIKQASEQITYAKLLESLLIEKNLVSVEEINNIQERVGNESYKNNWKFTLVRDVEELN